jgi:hypothetical protein
MEILGKLTPIESIGIMLYFPAPFSSPTAVRQV